MIRGLFQSSLLSGIIIAIASYGYAMTNGSYFGAILFAFGLMSIVYYELNLFTGDAGFVKDSYDNEDLALTLMGNVVGVIIGSVMLSVCSNDNTDIFITNALLAREVYTFTDLLRTFAKASFCGMILTIAVKCAREARDKKESIKMLPLLFGVPLFLTCGFYHSIVDSFYIVYGMLTTDLIQYEFEDCSANLLGWFIVVSGNLFGCNIPRLVMWDKNY